MMTNCITNTYLTYQIDLPSLWNFPACWLSLCEEIVEDLDMACGHGNLLTLGCCTSWHQLAPAGPSWSKVGQATRQNTDGGSTGYFVNIPTRPSQYYPVEFNHNFVCWTEITWNAPHNRWNIERPTG